MKILFAGPSLFCAAADLDTITCRPPAIQGDLLRAVEDGATVIGLVDGQFEVVASVWHKEILYALSRGVRVLGAASMGALRAAECAAFGMEPVGAIAARYVDGELDDDAAVAQVHGPAEIGFMPLSETLVDAEATLARLAGMGLISDAEQAALLASARRQFFKERTASSIVSLAVEIDPLRKDAILGAYSRHHYNLKAEDALLLVAELRESADELRPPPEWEMQEPQVWRRIMSSVVSEQQGDQHNL